MNKPAKKENSRKPGQENKSISGLNEEEEVEPKLKIESSAISSEMMQEDILDYVSSGLSAVF